MKNDTVPTRDYTVGDEEYSGLLPRCEMSLEIFLVDLSRERRHPLLRNRPGSGVNKPPLQHPATQQYFTTEIMMRLENGAWPQA